MNAIEISAMSKTEKLQTTEALWNSLIHEESEIESPAWHEDVLAARKQKTENRKLKS